MVRCARYPNTNTIRSRAGASEISQFIPSIYILFIIVFLPLINLGFAFVGAAVQYLATNDCAAKASTQLDYASALNAMASEAYQFQSTGLAKFLSLSPCGGYTACGDDLYIVSTNVASGNVTSSAADMPSGQQIDTGSNVYELSVKSIYSIQPLINLSSVPLIGDVPGVGKPFTLTFTANRPLEHPGGFQASSGDRSTGGTVTAFNRINSGTIPGGSPAANAGTWNNPTIFNQIKAAGETVISVNVVNVPSNFGQTQGSANGGWVPTGIVVNPGQFVWIDTQAVGTWGYVGSPGWTGGGNGFTSKTTGQNIDADLPNMMLIGYVGTPPILPWGHTTGAISGDPRFIPSGVSLVNYQVSLLGPISLASNDNQAADFGAQSVRIIVTQ